MPAPNMLIWPASLVTSLTGPPTIPPTRVSPLLLLDDDDEEDEEDERDDEEDADDDGELVDSDDRDVKL